MNFREEREKNDWSLQYVAEQTGYSVAAINGLELHNKGSYELRVKLHRLYGDNDPVPYGELQDRTPATPQSSDLDVWRRRAKAAERELHVLKSGMRRLLETTVEPEGPKESGVTRSTAGNLAAMEGSSWDERHRQRSDSSQPVIGGKLSKALDHKGSSQKERGGPGHKAEGQ